MNTRIQKWGNSLAIRIPKPFACELGLENNSEVELSFIDGKLVVSPLPYPRYSLTELLSAIRETEIHDEVDFGAPQGREAW